MLKYLTALAVLLVAVPALAQKPPTGQAVLNQARSGALITPSDEASFPVTRGIHVGDATPCNASVVFSADSTGSPVILYNLQPGIPYPYSIKRLRASNTTCTNIVGLR